MLLLWNWSYRRLIWSQLNATIIVWNQTISTNYLPFLTETNANKAGAIVVCCYIVAGHLFCSLFRFRCRRTNWDNNQMLKTYRMSTIDEDETAIEYRTCLLYGLNTIEKSTRCLYRVCLSTFGSTTHGCHTNRIATGSLMNMWRHLVVKLFIVISHRNIISFHLRKLGFLELNFISNLKRSIFSQKLKKTYFEHGNIYTNQQTVNRS